MKQTIPMMGGSQKLSGWSECPMSCTLSQCCGEKSSGSPPHLYIVLGSKFGTWSKTSEIKKDSSLDRKTVLAINYFILLLSF